jgi:DNA-binding transcriptional ArsR family regulator
MDTSGAIEAFTALAQSTRLYVFRRLLKAYPDQIAAGEIARNCKVPHNTMSTHLAVLTRSGLVAARREGRMMYYCADVHGFQSLVSFLTRDCCNGRAEICAPLLAELNCHIPHKKQDKVRA